MGDSNSLLGTSNTQNVFAQPFLQATSLLEGNIGLGIQYQPSNPLASNPGATVSASPIPTALLSNGTSLLFSQTGSELSSTIPLTSSASSSVDPLIGSSARSAQLTSASPPLSAAVAPSLPNFSIITEGKITANGVSDFDGLPLDLSDDALIYANKGYTMNGNITLPVQRNASGTPLRDANNRQILVPNALVVGPTYTQSTLSPNNNYAGLNPPPILSGINVTVPSYATLRQQELDRRIPVNTATVTFNPAQSPITTVAQWNQVFPSAGTATQPKVVRITNGNLTIPTGVTISNTVIIVESGNIILSGSTHTLNNVALIANAGSINLGNVQGKDISAMASSSVTMNGAARFDGSTLLANGSGNMTFNGATKLLDSTQNLTVVSQGDLTFDGAQNTRGTFISQGQFTFNGNSQLHGVIKAKGDILFNGGATVFGIGGAAPSDTTPPAITASLQQDTAPGGTNLDRITSNPTITGTATDANPIVELKAGFGNIPIANYVSVLPQRQSNGSFTLSATTLAQVNGTPLADGTYTLNLLAKDQAGNLSTFNYSFTLDTTVAAPINLDLITADDSGISSTDNITKTNVPKITGNAEIGSIVQLFNGGQVIGQATANATGNWEITTTALPNGVVNLTAVATDIAGNISAPSVPLSLTIDGVLPTTTVTTNLIQPLGNNASLAGTVDGTGSSVTLLTYRWNTGSEIELVRNGTGEFNQPLDFTGVANGAQVLTITATDTAGNVKSTAYNVTVNRDFVAPVIVANLQQDTGRSSNDRITFNPAVSGTVLDSSSVVSFRAAIDSAVAASFVNILPNRQADGSFSLSRTQLNAIAGGTLTDGFHSLNLIAVDEFGNTSAIVSVLFNLDTVVLAPSNFQLAAGSDSGISDTDRITKVNMPTITGLAEANAEVKLYGDQVVLGSTFANASGQWSITTNALANGAYNLTAIATDVAGNISPLSATFAVTIDAVIPGLSLTTNPATPIRNNTRLTGTIDGTGSAITAISYRWNTGAEIQLSPNATGLFDQAFDFTGIANGAQKLTITATDTAGNVLTQILNVNVDHDLQGPVIAAQLVTDTGNSSSDRITFNPTISGLVTDVSQVSSLTASIDGGAFGTILPQRQPDGSFTLTLAQLQQLNGGPLSDGVKTVRFTAQDEFGNQSGIFTITFTLDTVVLPPNNLLLVTDTGISSSDRITSTSTPTLSGVTEPGAKVALFNGLTQVGLATAGTDGRWQVTTSGLPDGALTLSAIATDIAGNVSQPGTIAIVIDTLQPLLTLGTVVTQPLKNDAQLTGQLDGTGSALINAQYRFDNGQTIPLTLNAGAFNQSFDFTGISNGVHSLTITATDAAGNIKSTTYSVTVEIDREVPVIAATLVLDTGRSNIDALTFDARITGTVLDANAVTTFRAGFDSATTTNFVNILAFRQAEGSFALSRSQLDAIYGGPIPDGLHSLKLQAQDEFGNLSPVFVLSFNLDTIPPAAPVLDLPAIGDSGVSNTDNITGINPANITGVAEFGSVVQVFVDGVAKGVVSPSADGNWSFATNTLTEGSHTFTATATDAAGNLSAVSVPLNIIIDTVSPTLTLVGLVEGSVLKNDARLSGSGNGTGSGLANAQYRFDTSSNRSIALSNTGAFDQALDWTGIANGSHTLTLILTDVAGNVTEKVFNVTVDRDLVGPVIGAALTQDTGSSVTDRITKTAGITGTVNDQSSVTAFRARFQGNATWTDVSSNLAVDGSFSLTAAQLAQVYGATLIDGAYNVELEAVDAYGNVSALFSTSWVLDTSLALNVSLDPTFDTAPVGDSQTTALNITLTGQSDSGATVTLQGTSAIADTQGKFTFSNLALAVGDNVFAVSAVDVAGNQRSSSLTIKRLVTNQAPTNILLTNTLIVENSVSGTVVGSLTTVDPDVADIHRYALLDDAGGRFVLDGDRLKVAPSAVLDFESQSQWTVKIRTTDSGNPNLFFDKSFVIQLADVNEAPRFTSNPIANAGTNAPYSYAITTADPENQARVVTAIGLPSWLNFVDNGNGTATLAGQPTPAQAGLYSINLKVTDSGGLSTTQTYLLAVDVVLKEDNRFNTSQSVSFKMPTQPTLLSFAFDPTFDLTDPRFINDVFEVALVDSTGKSLVQTIKRDRQSFFNVTEGEPIALASGVTYNTTTRTVTLNLTGIAPDANATLMFRLVNDDTDTTTQVRIRDIAFTSAPVGTLPALQQGGSSPTFQGVDLPIFNQLTDISSSVQAVYSETSFDAKSKQVYTEVSLRNIGTYSMDAPVLVAIRNLSNASVLVSKPDGFTPEGLPYFNFSSLVTGGKFNASTLTASRDIAFYNPQQAQFSYELVVLGQLNQAPTIQSKPPIEGLAGKPYTYQVQATDPNNDALTYKLLMAPQGMTIQASTGLIAWNPAIANLGNHSVLVQVADGRGGITTQLFNLTVTDDVPNRSPLFTTTPIVDAFVNQSYVYDSNAVDPDQDAPLTYTLLQGPDGMVIDPVTGKITWTPPASLVLGDTIIGSISTPGQIDEFSFSGTAGQRIYLDSLEFAGNYYDRKIRIVTPGGKELINSYEFFYYGYQFLTLPEAGNYRVQVIGQGDRTGKYGFSVIDLAQTPVIQVDNTIQGVLTPGTEDDIFRFNAFKGQRIYLDTISSNGSLDWTLYNSRLGTVVSSYNFSDLEAEILEDGEYLLAVRGRSSFNSTVNYSFVLGVPDLITKPLTVGSTVVGVISTKGEQDAYTFDGKIGQQLFLDCLQGTSYISLRLYDPTGKEVFYSGSQYDSGPDNRGLVLNMNGQYRLIVDGYNENVGNYSFRLLDRVATTETIALNQIVSGTFGTVLSETKTFNLVLTEKTAIFFDGVNGNGSWKLFAENGQVFQSGNIASNYEFKLEAGTYWFVPYHNDATSQEFSFQFITPPFTTQAITLGQKLEGRIDKKGERDTYTFNGVPGQQLFLDSLTGVSNIGSKLYDPTGKEIFSGGSQYDYGTNYRGLVLNMVGQYRLVVDGYDETVGDYAFRLLDRADTTDTIALNTVKTGTFGTALSSATTSNLVLTEKTKLFFDGITGSGNWRLFAENGEEVKRGYVSSNYEFELEAGRYWFVPYHENSNEQNFSFNFITPTFTTQSLILGQPTLGSISKGSQNTYTFNGVPGQQLFFDSIEGLSTIYTKLYDPTGKEVFSGSLQSDSAPSNRGLILNMNGEYRLIVDGSDEAMGAYKFQILDKSQANSVNLGSAISGSFVNNTTSQSYQFELTSSRKILIDGISGNGEYQIYDQSGYLVRSDYLTRDLTLDLSKGSYWLILVPNNNSISPFGYEVQIIDQGSGSLVSPTGIPLVINTKIEGSLASSGQQKRYLFDGTAGQQIFFDGLSGSNLIARIYDPSGREILNSFTNDDPYSYYSGLVLKNSGTYQVTIESYYGGTGGYSFRLLDKASAVNHVVNPVILTGDPTLSGIFSNLNETQLHRFSLSDRTYLYFDGLQGSHNWKLYKVNGEEVTRGATSSDSEFWLDSGEYIVAISQYNSGDINYSLKIITPQFPQLGTVSYESIVSGSLDEKGQQNTYTFQGQIGEKLFFDGLTGSNIYVYIYDPNGRLVLGVYSYSTLYGQISSGDREFNPNFILSSNGKYTIVIDGYQVDSIGSYSFRLLNAANATVETINPASPTGDPTLSGSFSGLNGLNETKLHRFNLSDRTYLYFDGLQGSHNWKLYKANGEEVTRSSTNSDSEFWLDSGEYIVAISQYNSGDINYSLKIITPQFPQLGSVSYESIVSGSLDEKGQQNTYTFQGQIGEKLFFDGLTGSNIYVYIYDPNGRLVLGQYYYSTLYGQVSSGDGEFNPNFILSSNGTYKVVIDGSAIDSTGSYSFRLLNTSNAVVQPIDLTSPAGDLTLSGTFSLPNETQLHRFRLTDRSYLYFDGLQGSHSWNVYKANGDRVNNGSTSYDSEFWLDSGDYIVSIARNSYADTNYSLKIVTPNLPELGAIVYGTTINGSLSEKGQQNRYTFQGKAGQQIYLDGLSGNNTVLYIYDPNGRLILGNGYYSNSGVRIDGDYGPSSGLHLDLDGDYSIVIDGSANDTIGTYSFRLLNGEDATEVNLNQDYTGTFSNDANNTVLYRFTATAGQEIYLDTGLGQYPNTWTLYSPSGQSIAEGSIQEGYSSDDKKIKLPAAGEYLLALSGKGAVNPAFKFHVATVRRSTIGLTPNQVVTGALTTRGEQNIYTFSAQAGQRFFFDGLTGSSGIKAKLVTPSQTQVWDYAVNGDSVPFTMTESGQYQIIIEGDLATRGSYSFQLQNLVDIPTLPIGSAVTGTIASDQSVVLYKLEGQIGQTFNFDWAAPYLNGLNWVLYGSNNQVVGMSTYYYSPDFRATLPATGSHTLAVSKTTSGAVNYGFTVVNETPTAIVAVSGLDRLIGETEFSSRSGTIAAGEVKTSTFTAPVGTRIHFDSKDFDDDSVQVSVLNPDGTIVFSGSASLDVGPVLLSQSGTFTIQVKGKTASSSGDYQFSLMEVLTKEPGFLDDVRRLTLNAEITKPLSPGRTTDILAFEGKVGQHLLFDGILPDGASFSTFKVDAKLIGPSGQVIFDLKSSDYPYTTGSAKDFAPFTLTEGGTYNLIISGQQDTPSEYRFKMWDLDEAEPLLLNRLYAENLLRGSDVNFYKVSGTAGQRLFFNSIAGRSTDQWVLYRRGNNQELIRRTLNEDFEYTLPSDGEYILAVQGGSTTPATYRFAVQAIQEPKAIIVPGKGESGGTQSDELGLYPVRVRVSDGKGGLDEQIFKIRVNPTEGNAIPYIVSEAQKRAMVNAIYRYDVDAVDADREMLTYSLVDGPGGMLIDNATGQITWQSPIAGTHQVKVRVADTSGGFDYQSFELIVDGTANAWVSGTVYNDLDQTGTRKITNPNNLTPYAGVTIGDRFKDSYTPYDLGLPKGLPMNIGAMTFYRDANGVVDPNTLLVAGSIESCGGVIFKVKVQRGDGGHIIGFDDDFDAETPYVAEFFAYSPYISAGLVYDPVTNTLIKSSAKGAYTSLTYVPTGVSGAGDLKGVKSTAFYTIQNGVSTQTGLIPNYSTGLVYMAANSPDFGLGAELLIANRVGDLINSYQIDGNGNPIIGTETPFLKDIDAPMGALIDPVTKDVLFSSAGQEVDNKNTIVVVRGLGKPVGNEPGMGNWLVYVDRDQDGIRDSNEEFTYTDQQGNYKFNLAAGNYQIREELQAGWTQTAPTNPNYRNVTLSSNQFLYGMDFGNFGAPANSPNLDPHFASNPILQVLSEQRYLYRAAASDLNGDVLTFELVQGPNGMAVSSGGVATWQPNDQQVGTHQVILRVSDGKGGIDLQAYTLTVQQGNRRPVITSTQPSNTAIATKLFRYQVTASDLDGDALTYAIVPNQEEARSMPAGVTLSSTGLLTWTPTSAQVGGAYVWGPDNDIVAPWQVTVKVSDGKGGLAYQQVDLLVDSAIANRAPEIISQPRTSVSVGTDYFYEIQAKDADGDRLTYSVVEAPAGMTLSSGLLTWKPGADQLGKYTVVVNVSDGTIATQQRWTISTLTGMTNQLVNHAPTIASTPQVLTNVGDSYEYQFVAADQDNDVLFWELESGPVGMALDNRKLNSAEGNTKVGYLRWQPDAKQIGTHDVTLRVLDAYGAYSSQTFTIVVTGVNAPPEIVSIPLTKIGVSDRYSYQVIATDLEQDPLNFVLLKKPEGMTIHPTTGVISWQPSAAQLGTQSVEVLVQDPEGGQSIQQFKIVVELQTVNHSPAISSTPIFVGSPGVAYQYQVVANDPDAGNTLTYQLLSAPVGVTINSTTGLLSWANPTIGVYQIVVGSIDQGGLGAAQGFSLTVRSNSAPVIQSTPVQTIALGTSYRYDVRATDAENDALSYALNQGAIDRGVRMDALGRLSWTPQGSDLSVPVSVIVTVKDAQGAAVTQNFTIGVIADTEAPQVTLRATRNLLNVGEAITFEARAIDNVSVAGLKLVVNGQAIILDAQGRATKQFDTVQTITAVATAIDGAGNTSSSTPLLVDVIDPTGAFDPVFGINGSLLPEGFITAPTPVFGSVGGTGFARYELAIGALNGENFTVIASGTSTIANGKLGTIDPTLLQNDAYTLRLLVYGTNGVVQTIDETVNIAGELKLGNFRLSFTDLAIPVTGIPISLTRTYDTLTANESDDFGYGWRMEFRDTNLRTSVRKRSEEEEILGSYPPFDDRTKVYITLPGGKREAYSFKPKMVEEIDDVDLGIFAKYFYDPVFESEKGSTNKLTLEYNGYVRQLENGKFTNPIGSSPFNPADGYYGGVYVLTTKDGTKYRIDAATGDLLTVADTNGNTLTYSDDAIVSSTGEQITFERDANGRIASVQDPAGSLVTYGYDANGDLLSVSDREQNTTRMVYDTSYDDPNYVGTQDVGREKRSHYLREIIDPLGRVGARTEYDETGRLKQIVNVNGQAVDMGYDLANDRQVVRDQLGNETIYVYDNRGNVLTEIDAVGKITKRKYDDDNNLLEEVLITPETGVNGYKTKYTYDGQGNQLTRTNAMDETDIYTYNSQGKLLTSTDALGNTTKYAYDSRGNTISKLDAVGNLTNYVYYENGLTKTIVEGANQVGIQDVTTFGYDRYGNETYKKNAVGNETFSRYDRSGNELSETHKLTTSHGVETLTTTKTYDKSGKVKTVLDAGNGLTTYEYDANGNQTEVLNALGQKTLMIYDAKNQLLETILADDTPNTLTDNQRLKNEYDVLGNKTAIVDQNGRRTAYNYDALKRPTGMVLPDGTPNNLTDNPKVDVIYNKLGWMTKLVKDGVTTEFEYDKVGRITRTWVTQNGQRQENSTVYDKAGRSIAATDVLGNTTKYVYDALDRVTETIYTDGKSDKTVYNYAGKELSKTDRASHTTQYQYDAIDRLTAVVDALNHKTAYAYDEAGNLIRQTDANQQVTQYEYDGLNRRTAVIRPMGEHSETVYDKLGRVTETKDFNGSVIQYGYDEKNELVSKKFVNEENRLETYTTAIDARSRSVSDARGTTSYTYDERGRMLSKTEPDGKQISYTYDSVTGKVASVTTPSGTTQYRYNALGQLAKVVAAEGETVYAYNAIGNLQTKTLANGIVETYGYDGLNRVKLVEQKNVSGTVIGKYFYSYDLVGNKTKVEELDGRSVAYSYDDLYRLTKEVITDSVHGNRTMEYVYDAVGNRLLKRDSAIGDTTYAYNANDRLLNEKLNGITTVYTYDNNGNTKTKTAGAESTVYVWDTQNRLMGATINKNGQVQQLGYEYNVAGLKTRAIVDGVETRYLLDENRQYAQVLEEYNNAGVQSHYVYGSELDLISQIRDSSASFYLDDAHSGVRQLTDTNGVITDQYGYDGYGNVIYSADNTQNAYQYRGEQSDLNLGIQYLRARYYDMKNARFLNEDSFEGYQENPISRHKYMYANDNPISGQDPTGWNTMTELSAAMEGLGILAAAAAAQFYAGKLLSKFDARNPVKWKGIQAGFSLSGVLPISTGSTVISATGKDEAKSYSGSWLILSGSPSLGLLNPYSTPFSLTAGTFSADSPGFLGASPGALQGGYLQARVGTAVVGAGFTLYSRFIMGYGDATTAFNFTFVPTFGLRLGFFGLASGISIALPGSYESALPQLPG